MAHIFQGALHIKINEIFCLEFNEYIIFTYMKLNLIVSDLKIPNLLVKSILQNFYLKRR